jgi:hypothetical protein
MKIIDLFFGHKRVVDDKGDHVSYLTRKEAYDAVERSNVEVEKRQSPQWQQEGTESLQPEASGSDHAE